MNDEAMSLTRPRWANVLLAFCAFMAFVYTPWDLFWKPVARDQEVWFGVVLHGWAAKATEPLHGLIYGAFAYGLWKMRPWMRPWGSLYLVQVTIAMVVWGLTDERGSTSAAVASAVVFSGVTWAYWRASTVFEHGPRA